MTQVVVASPPTDFLDRYRERGEEMEPEVAAGAGELAGWYVSLSR
jgi:hypothetical protein